MGHHLITPNFPPTKETNNVYKPKVRSKWEIYLPLYRSTTHNPVSHQITDACLLLNSVRYFERPAFSLILIEQNFTVALQPAVAGIRTLNRRVDREWLTGYRRFPAKKVAGMHPKPQASNEGSPLLPFTIPPLHPPNFLLPLSPVIWTPPVLVHSRNLSVVLFCFPNSLSRSSRSGNRKLLLN